MSGFDDYRDLCEERDQLRAELEASRRELFAYQADVEGANRRELSFATACVRNVEGITVGGALEMQRDEIASLRAELAELRAQVPVAYMHNKRADVIHTSVKSLLSDFAVNYGPESMLRPIDKSEHYTIPLYAAPVPAQPAADVAAIAKAVRDIPSRIESLGGQRFAYVKLSEVIDTIYSMAGKHPAVPEDVAKDAERYRACRRAALAAIRVGNALRRLTAICNRKAAQSAGDR